MSIAAVFAFSSVTAKFAAPAPWNGSMKQTRKTYFLPCVTSGFVQEVPTIGTPAFSATSPPAIASDEPYVPIIAQTFSRSMRRLTAFAASTLSLLLSTTTSSIFLPSTSGYCLCARFTPSSSSCPPTAFPPVIGRYTPILTVSAAAAIPAAANTTARASANRLATFIQNPLFYEKMNMSEIITYLFINFSPAPAYPAVFFLIFRELRLRRRGIFRRGNCWA